jgi:hypothetical protein
MTTINKALIGRRLQTKVPDANEVERGLVKIPIGWLGTIESFDGGHYTVAWDDDAEGHDMGWCRWTAAEIEADAILLAAPIAGGKQ